MLQLSLYPLSELNFMAFNLSRTDFQRILQLLKQFQKNFQHFLNFLKTKNGIGS